LVGQALLPATAALLDRDQVEAASFSEGILDRGAACVPALAAIASMCRPQTPWWRTSSEMIRRAAISPWVNLAARAGGIGPEAARCRRRAIDVWLAIGGALPARLWGRGCLRGACQLALADGLRSGLGVIIRQRTGGVCLPELGGQMVKFRRSRCRYGAREVFNEH
jgi:hypothetical protein